MNAIHMPTELPSGVAEMDDQHDRLFNEIAGQVRVTRGCR